MPRTTKKLVTKAAATPVHRMRTRSQTQKEAAGKKTTRQNQRTNRKNTKTQRKNDKDKPATQTAGGAVVEDMREQQESGRIVEKGNQRAEKENHDPVVELGPDSEVVYDRSKIPDVERWFDEESSED